MLAWDAESAGRHATAPSRLDSPTGLHLIAVCRLRYCDRTRGYAERRAREGKSQREIIGCLKRYIAREVYNTLQADLSDLQSQPPRQTTTILCGSPGFGITRKRA